MEVKLAICAAALCAAPLFLRAQEPVLTREGQYWVRTATASFPVTPRTKLQVSSRGRIILRGGNVDQVSYRLVQRVRAGTEAEARRLIGVASAAKLPAGVITRLVVSPSSSMAVTNDLEITVPRSLMGILLETQVGGIEAYDLDGDVQVKTPAGEIRMDQIKGNVSGRTGGGEIRLGRIGGTVHCSSGGGSIFLDSAGGETICETAGGEIVVKEVGGPLSLSTEGGNISVERAAGNVDAHSAGGLIDVRQAAGMVNADTRGGSIQIGNARGVKAEAAAGGIRTKSGDGPLRIATAAGNILAELSGARVQNSSLLAGSGDITVLIPSNLAVSVMARNQTGATPRIVSDFPEVRAQTVGFVRPPFVAKGAINGGGPLLDISAASGVIYLRKIK